MSVLEDVALELFGKDVFSKLRDEKWFVIREKPDRLLAVPRRPRVANVFVVVEAQSELLIRHEGADDFTEFEVAGRSVPGILNTKMQAVWRRTMLGIQYDYYEKRRESLMKIIRGRIADDKYIAKLSSWVCYLAPRARSAAKKEAEVIEPYCTVCPSCLIFGYAAQEEAGMYNVKSRVEGDVYYGLCTSAKCVVQRTFNAVDDVTKTTIYGGGEERTGALYRLSLIEPGTVFVGKVALRDMTLAELLLALVALARISRVGGRQTHFGRIKVYVPAIVFSGFEKGSGYEVAQQIFSKGVEKAGLEEALNAVTNYAHSIASSEDIVLVSRDLADKLRNLELDKLYAIVEQAWLDVLVFKKSLDMFVYSSTGKKR
ncbi:MAG TPA: type I-D CRISPR-associated protein Cas7/Csc2 [Pyrodictium sp.]|nr:type I-D CRISPR-associated protein Cas7/Csc2 [Pyrodictium sp.]